MFIVAGLWSVIFAHVMMLRNISLFVSATQILQLEAA